MSVGLPCLYGALFDSLLHVDNTHASLYFQFPSWSRIFWWQWGSHCLSGRRLAYGSIVWGLITKISSKIASIEGEEGEFGLDTWHKPRALVLGMYPTLMPRNS